MKQYIMNKYVISRGNYSGVMFGKVLDASDDLKVVVLEEAVNLYEWQSEKGTGNINSAINSTLKDVRFEKTPGGVAILTENYSVFPATDEQVKIIQKHAKVFA